MNEELKSQEISLNGVTFSLGDIHNVVDIFYGRIQADPVLEVPFRSVHDWPEHIERLTNFWWGRFGGQPFMFAEYNPPMKHFFAGFNEELLQRWLGIFHEVLAENLRPEQAALWKTISERMGYALNIKNEMIRAHHAEKQKGT